MAGPYKPGQAPSRRQAPPPARQPQRYEPAAPRYEADDEDQDEGEARAADAGDAPRTRRWAPRANTDAPLPPLADLNPYEDAPFAEDDADAEHSESETFEDDRPDAAHGRFVNAAQPARNARGGEVGGTEEFRPPAQRARSGKRRATGPVLMPREVEGPARDAVAVPTRIDDPRIDLDLARARRDEDEVGVPPRLRGQNIKTTRSGPDSDLVERPQGPKVDAMLDAVGAQSGPRTWVVLAIVGGIGLIAAIILIAR